MDLQEFLKQQAEQLQSIPDDFIERVAESQRQIANRIIDLFSSLERDGDGIVQSEKNLEIADEIRNALPGVLSKSQYSKAINSFVKDLDKQKVVIDKYLNTTFGVSASNFANAVFESTKKNAVEVLASSTVVTKFLEPLKTQIDLAVQNGQSFRESVKQLRNYATGGSPDAGAQIAGRAQPGGKLLQYSKQIAYDSTAIADRAYTHAMADEIDAEWFLYAGGVLPTSRDFCLDRVGKYFHRNEIRAWASLTWQGKPQNLNEDNIFDLLGGHNCQHTLIPVTIEVVPADVIERNIANGNYIPNKTDKKKIEKAKKDSVEETKKAEQEKEIKQFQRDFNLTGELKKIQDDSIRYFVENKDKLVVQYIKEFGNVVNTDDARKLFDVVGYNGSNASAVHEAASALNKLVTKHLIETGRQNHVVMYAGGAGSGKTSAIEGMFKGIKKTADVVIDGTMATYGKSIRLIDDVLTQGKTVDVVYVYRDPTDAWVNGVVKRMLENVSERGRVVPLRVFLENTVGSKNTISELLKLKNKKGVNISMIDNSLGKGNAALLSEEKFNQISFADNLKEKLIEETKKLVESGRITREQYEALTELKWVEPAESGTIKDYFKAITEVEKAAQKEFTSIEFSTVKDYTGSYYSRINRHLRGIQSAAVDESINNLDSALEKLPKYEGESFRAMSFESELNFRKMVADLDNGFFADAGYLSTSQSMDVAKSFLSSRGAGSVLLKIKRGLTGRAIKNLSEIQGEEEILFPRKTKWRVISKKEIQKAFSAPIIEYEIEQVL